MRTNSPARGISTQGSEDASSSRVLPACYVPESEPAGGKSLEDAARFEPSLFGETARGGVTLSELEAIALANNPAVAAAAARVEALRGKWVQVGLPPNPVIGYQGAEMGGGTAGQQGGIISQEFVRGGKLGLNRAVVSQEVARAEYQWAAWQQRVLTDVRIAYYDVLIAQRKSETTSELVKLSEEAVRASRNLLEAEEISRVELLQAEVEADQATILLRRAKNETQAAWRRLATVLGTPDMERQPLEGTLEDVAREIRWDEALQRLLNESPETAAALAGLDRARWALDQARASAVPNVDVQVSIQHDNGMGDTITGVQVGLPLPIVNRNQGGIQQAYAEMVDAQRNVQRVELDLERRLADAYRRYADARFQVDKYAQDILPKAKETLDLVTSGYQQGEMGYLTFLTAQRTYFQTNLSYIDSLRELWAAVVEIEGLLLKDSLQERQ